VVEFEHANVAYPAFLARASKMVDQLAFDAPIAFLPTPVGSDPLALGAAIAVMPSRFAIRRQTAHAFVPSVHDVFYHRASHVARLFDIACDRIRKAYAQPDMFVQRAPEPKQEALGL